MINEATGNTAGIQIRLSAVNGIRRAGLLASIDKARDSLIGYEQSAYIP
jgi:hypothetical protein